MTLYKKHITYYSILLLVIIIHIIWHYYYIKSNSGMNSSYKAMSIIVTSIPVILALIWQYKQKFLYVIPFSLLLLWTLKDASLGYLLHKDIFYLGTGKFDTFVSEMFYNGKILLFMKVFAMAIVLRFSFKLRF